MAVGLISKEEFLKKAQHLQRRSQILNDGWNCIKICDDVVLCKTVMQQIAYRGQKGIQDLDTQRAVDDGTEDLEDMTDTLDEETDTACLTVDTPTMSDILRFEYHVVYNESYSVPVLYLNVTKSDGKLISLEELWDLIPSVYRDRLEADKWTFLTQQEHPLLGRPFYQLHPCHTEKLMTIMQTQNSSEDGSTRNYLISWLSAVGPVVNLKLPLQYGKIT